MTDETQPKSTTRARTAPVWRRLVAVFLFALTLAFSAYFVINMSEMNARGFGSLWFLAVLPAFLSALICYIGDPKRRRGAGFYWIVPVLLVAAVCAGSAYILHEAVICLIMLSPVWLIAGWIGAFVLWFARKRAVDPTVFNSSLLLLPLLAGLAESQVTFPHETHAVTREVVIHASADKVWPFAVANAHIDDTEGHWNFSQNIAGLPRPRATVMHGEGVGAVRTAYWGDHISFDEVVTGWRPGRELSWDFRFRNASLQTYTDRHISPDGAFLKIDSGGYTLEPLPNGDTRLTLTTRYIARSHANAYGVVWGEIWLGDIQSNVLSIIKARAEKAGSRAAAG